MTPIKWYSKRQDTVETSTYDSDQEATRIAQEALLDMRYTLRMLGIGLEETSYKMSNKKSILWTPNLKLLTSNVKKKNEVVAYPKCRTAIAARNDSDGSCQSNLQHRQKTTKPWAPTGNPSIWMDFYLDATTCMMHERHYGFHPSRGVVEKCQ
jgi:hypothetical protein